MQNTHITLLSALCVLIFTGCGTFVPVRDLKEIPPNVVADAVRVKVYTIDNARIPDDFEVLEEITAYSCKHLLTDPPASKGDALKRLQIEAVYVGANAIINVTFDTRGTDAYGTNCWESVQATGIAIIEKN